MHYRMAGGEKKRGSKREGEKGGWEGGRGGGGKVGFFWQHEVFVIGSEDCVSVCECEHVYVGWGGRKGGKPCTENLLCATFLWTMPHFLKKLNPRILTNPFCR